MLKFTSELMFTVQFLDNFYVEVACVLLLVMVQGFWRSCRYTADQMRHGRWKKLHIVSEGHFIK
jgi:hypothetical protein